MLLGITAQNHDASMALIDGESIVWAAHSERYSRKKNDDLLNDKIINDLKNYGWPEKIIWFEKPWQKNFRRLYAGQRPWLVDPKQHLRQVGLSSLPIEYVGHHLSHACAGFYTSTMETASILVIDAIGEWDTVSIWKADHNGMKSVFKKKYPDSIGLFYTAFTHYLDLKPNEEEYILMGMAALGKPVLKDKIIKDFFSEFKPPYFKLKKNLHQGCKWWEPPKGISKFDIAASVQAIAEEYIFDTALWIKNNLPSNNFIFMGGCALNCLANSKILQSKIFDNIWIMPNPGDAGSAIGAVSAYNQKKIKWDGPYLGTDIQQELDIKSAVKKLLQGELVAIANGRAEFGPRALGNRSLLCDPRGADAKLRMNKLKKREEFRPFAPAILEEYAQDYFDMPTVKSPYMQFVFKCKYPDQYPGICHVDNTSRVQTVSKNDNLFFRLLLEEWHRESGCPMLMNTSLNVKGEPLVNSWEDAIRWQQINGIDIF